MKKAVLPYLAVISGFAALVVALYYQIVVLQSLPGSPDSVTPMALTRALDLLYARSGSYPLWQPWTFSGMPTVEAFSYLGGLYLPNMMFRFLHPEALHLQLLHLVFAGAGGYALMRSFGLHQLAAALAGAAFMLNPFMTAMLVYGHGSQLMTAAWIPWVAWAALRLCERGRLADAGVLALFLGLQLQRAHVQIAWYTWLLLVPFLIVQLSTAAGDGKFPWKKAGLAVLAMVTGVAISLQIYLPSLGYLPFSARATGTAQLSAYEYATMWSMHPAELLTYLLPGAFGFGGVAYWGFMPFTDFPHYAGFFVLALAVAGVWYKRSERRVWLFVAIAILAVFLSFGRFFSPVHDLFYSVVPLFRSFRVPSMALILVAFSLSVLAGFGLQAFIDRPLSERSPILKWGALAIALMAVMFLVFENSMELQLRSMFPPPAVEQTDLAYLVNKVRWLYWREGLFMLVLMAGAGAGLLWLSARKSIDVRFAAVVLVLLAVGDLFRIDLQIVYPDASSLRLSPLVAGKNLRKAIEGDEITAFLAGQQGEFRIYPAGELFAENKFCVAGIESVGGYHAAKLGIYQDALAMTDNLANLDVLRMLNVRYVLTTSPLEVPGLVPVKSGILRLVSHDQPVMVYRLEEAMPRAWFAPEVIPAADDAGALTALMASGMEGGRVYVPEREWRGPRRFSGGTVLSLTRTVESLALRVRAEGDAFLALSEVDYPLRWRVTVDGRERKVVRVNGLIRGLPVARGTHDIRFEYDRGAFDLGLRLSSGALLLAALMMLSGVFMRGRDGAASAKPKPVLR